MSGGDDGESAQRAPRSSLRAAARDRRVWAILAVVAALIVCCCSAAVGVALSLFSGVLAG